MKYTFSEHERTILRVDDLSAGDFFIARDTNPNTAVLMVTDNKDIDGDFECVRLADGEIEFYPPNEEVILVKMTTSPVFTFS